MARGRLGVTGGRLGLRGAPLGVKRDPLAPPRGSLGMARVPVVTLRRASRHSKISGASSLRTRRKGERYSPCAERTSRCSASACPPMERTPPHGDTTFRYAEEDPSEDRERLYEDGKDLCERREDRSPLGGRPVAIPSGPPRMRRGALGKARDSLPAPSGTPRRPSGHPATPSGHFAVPRRPLRIRPGPLVPRGVPEALLRPRGYFTAGNWGARTRNLGKFPPDGTRDYSLFTLREVF
jgi:hypothetical protein